jgi:hypothetical protein
VIDAADPAFAALLLWSDRDGDGRSTQAELVPDHDCEGERAAMTGVRSGSVVDVYLPRR